MSRPLLEVADLVRSAGAAFIGRNRNWIRWTHIKVLLAIARCRTAALGGHIDECTRCGHRATIWYNSCRNRHCPKCQTGARERWIEARRSELLPSPYVHVVFTLPPQLAALALQNKKVIYGLLLRASAETLLEVARNPTHLGAEIGGSRRNIVSEEDPAAAGVVGTVNRRFKVLWENRSLVFPQNRQFPQRISPAQLVYAADRTGTQKNAPGSAPGARNPRASTNFV